MKQDRDIIRDTIRKEEKRLFRFISNLVPAKEDAEDIVQDVFYQLIIGVGEIRQLEKVTGWLYGVARNRVKDWYKKKKPLNFNQIEGKVDGLLIEELFKSVDVLPDKDMWRESVTEALEIALEEIPADQKEVFIKHELEDKSFKEIAIESGVSVNTLISRKRYAVLHLRKRLFELYNELNEIE